MTIKQTRVSLAFASGTEDNLDVQGGTVLDKFFGTTPPPADPPVTQVQLESGLTAFRASRIARKNGGPAATAAKNNRMAELIEMMKKLALYVQINCGNDMETLLASGFLATSTNTASYPLPAPESVSAVQGMSGEMVLKTKRIVNALTYEYQYAALGTTGEPEPWSISGLSRKSREITVSGLTPGAMYIFRIRAVGGSTGYSDWSNVVSGRVL
ncbi:MAG: fibronectin type III domain-containing protein [Luteolibacter sp.]|uniref:fibronectin type III domain-containing protein n=1 Tax=Luteolibacter sp. TaxID=1962973 RepID=UPI0032665D32